MPDVDKRSRASSPILHSAERPLFFTSGTLVDVSPPSSPETDTLRLKKSFGDVRDGALPKQGKRIDIITACVPTELSRGNYTAAGNLRTSQGLEREKEVALGSATMSPTRRRNSGKWTKLELAPLLDAMDVDDNGQGELIKVPRELTEPACGKVCGSEDDGGGVTGDTLQHQTMLDGRSLQEASQSSSIGELQILLADVMQHEHETRHRAHTWKSRLEEAEEQLKIAEQRRAAAVTQTEMLENGYISLRERYLNLQESHREADSMRSAAEASLKTAQARIEELTRRIKIKDDGCASLLKEHRRALSDIEILQERLERMTKFVQKLITDRPSCLCKKPELESLSSQVSPDHQGASNLQRSFDFVIEGEEGARNVREHAICDTQELHVIGERTGSERQHDARLQHHAKRFVADDATRALRIEAEEGGVATKVSSHQPSSGSLVGRYVPNNYNSAASAVGGEEEDHVAVADQNPPHRRSNDASSAVPHERLSKGTPFASAKESSERIHQLEASLLKLNMERESLESVLSKVPSGSHGRTVAERRRVVDVEARLEEVRRDLSRVKRELRQLGAV